MKRFLLLVALVASPASAQERAVFHFEGPASMFRNQMNVDISSTSQWVPSVKISAEGSRSHCARAWTLADRAIDAAYGTARHAIKEVPRKPAVVVSKPSAYRVTWWDGEYFMLDLPDSRVNMFRIPEEYRSLKKTPNLLYGYVEILPYSALAFHDTHHGVTCYDALDNWHPKPRH